MATKTEALIYALRTDVGILSMELESLRREADPLTEVTKQVAILQYRLDELTKSRDSWGHRWWGLLIAVVGVGGIVMGVLLGYFLPSLQ